MMEDIVGDYKDKTVTLEDFPFFANNIKMASVHPCKHASVMKTLTRPRRWCLENPAREAQSRQISTRSKGCGYGGLG